MLTFILGYAVVLAALGLFLSRSVRSAGDFFVAGRRLNTPLLFSTFLAANLGAGTTVGAASLGYDYGLSAWWWVGSAGLGSLVLAFWIGPRIHHLATVYNLYTVGDFLELRYNQAVRLLTAGILWLGALAILAGQLLAMGLALNVVAGIPQAWGCALGGVIVTLYFTAGGLWGSAWINSLQVLIKAVGFCLALGWALQDVGGWGGLQARLLETAPQPERYLSLFGVGMRGILAWAVILIPSFFVSPGLLQKLFGARDEGVVRRAVGLQGLCLLVYSFFPTLLGMIAFVRWPELESSGLALPKLLADGLPTWLGGLMLAAIFSAEISSADAVLFMISTSVARDLGPAIVRAPLTDAQMLRFGRAAAVVAGALGVALAIWLDSIIAALVIFYSLLTVTLFAPLLGGLFSRRPTASAAIAAMAAGVPTTLAVHAATFGQGFGVVSPALAGIAASVVFFTLFSLRRPVSAVRSVPLGRVED
ncbi:MAG: sodium:solute symporter family protein [Acidobacteria bacterium]|nr:sodium:solute symporter family protein [Acidobacteriota bacterium]